MSKSLTLRRLLQYILFVRLCPSSTSVPMSKDQQGAEVCNPKKTIYLVRHAESEENRRIGSLKGVFTSFGSLQLPSKKDFHASLELLNVSGQIDSSVSNVGKEQIADMHRQLQEADFLQNSGTQLIVHSPLGRAKETCAGIFKGASPSTTPVRELEQLFEKTPSEWVPGLGGTLKRRIEDLETWITEQPETVISMVGHSQYFKNMLGLDFKFGNCDVWKVEFESESQDESSFVHEGKTYSLPHKWSNLERLYACKEDYSQKEQDTSIDNN